MEAESSKIDTIIVPTLHSLFPLSIARVKGPSDPSPLLVLSEIKDVLLSPLVGESAFQRTKTAVDTNGKEYYVRREVTQEERRVLVLLECLSSKSTTNVILGKCALQLWCSAKLCSVGGM